MTETQWNQVLGFAGSALAVLVGRPFWKSWRARQNANQIDSEGEAGWARRQAAELERYQQLVTDLMEARRLDAALISRFKVREALATERMDIMANDIRKLKEIVLQIRPDLDSWIRTDYAPLDFGDTVPGPQDQR